MMKRGVDIKRSDETLLGVDAQCRHLRRMLIDEPLRKSEAEHRLSFLDLTLFRIPDDG